MTMQETRITDSEVAFRCRKIAEHLAQGYTNQAELARIFKAHESTISRDVQYLREEATAQLTEYLNDLPLQHLKARTAVDLVRFAFETMDNVNTEQRLEAANLILKATEIKLDFLSDVTAMDKAVKNVKTMKEQIARFQKEAVRKTQPQPITVPEPTETKKVKRKSVRKSH